MSIATETKSDPLSTRFDQAIARMDGDVGLLRKMAAMTSPDFPDVIDETVHALRAGDAEQAETGLHKLKGMLSIFDADGVTVEVHEMLRLVRQDEFVEAKEHFDLHRPSLDKLVAEITSIAIE